MFLFVASFFSFLSHFAFLSSLKHSPRPSLVHHLASKEEISPRRFQITSPLPLSSPPPVPPSPSQFTLDLHFPLWPLLSQTRASNVKNFSILASIDLLPAAVLPHCYKIHCIDTPTTLIQRRNHGRSPQILPHYLPPPPPPAGGHGLFPPSVQLVPPGPRRRRRRLPQVAYFGRGIVRWLSSLGCKSAIFCWRFFPNVM